MNDLRTKRMGGRAARKARRAAPKTEEQKAIWLRCFERVPIDEITRLLGIEASTGARGVLQRARRKLRTALDRSGVGDMGT